MNITPDQAQRLIDNLDEILGDREQLFRTAYELGFNAGLDVGHTQAQREEEQGWAHLAAHIRGLGTSDSHSFEEMEHRRWGGPRDQFGKPRPGDHPGGPVDYDTGQPIPAQPEPARRDPWATLPGAAA